MKRMKRIIAITCAMILAFTTNSSMAILAEEPVNGNTVRFDGSGYFTDELEDFSNVYDYKNVVTVSGSALQFKGDDNRVKKEESALEDGYLVYDAGAGESFNSVSIDVGGFEKYNSSAFLEEHLAVYTGVVSGSAITYGTKLELDQEIATDRISDNLITALRYTPRNIPEGTRYLIIALPDTTYEITKISMEKVDADSLKFTEFFTDEFDYSGTYGDIPDTETYKNISQESDAWDFAAFAYDTSLIVAKGGESNPTVGELNYHMPFNIKYFSLTSYNWHAKDQQIDNIQFYASKDGINYSEISILPTSPDPILANETQPSIYRFSNLPKDTQYLRVTWGSAWGPKLSKIMIKGVEPSADNIMAEAVDTLDNFNNIYDSSSNLQFEDAWPTEHGNDASRIRRTADEDAYIVYKTTNDIKAIEFDTIAIYGVDWGSDPDDLRVYVSTDGVDFSTEIDVTRDPSTEPVEYTNNLHHYTNTSPIPDGYQYIKITITGHSWDGSTPQLGNVKLVGFAPFAFETRTQRNAEDTLADLNMMTGYSENIKFETQSLDGYDFGGDVTRVSRAADSTDALTLDYKTTNAVRSAIIDVYAYYKASQGYAPEPIIIQASSDGISFKENGIRLTADTVVDPEGGWQKISYSTSTLPSGTTYVRVKFSGTTDKASQIGNVTLGGVNIGERQFNIIPGKAEVERSVTGDIKYVADPIRIDGVIETDIDGNPTGEWAGADLFDVPGVTDAEGEKGAKVYLKYDYDNLYFVAKIKDPTPLDNTNVGGDLWGGDNFELFFGTEDINYIEQPGKKNTMIDSDVQIVLAGGVVDGVAHSYHWLKGVFTYPPFLYEVTADEDGLGYTMEAAIPLSLIGIAEPWNNAQMIFNPEINIYTPDGGRQQWGWAADGEALKKSRGLWGLATFESVEAPKVEITAEATYAQATGAVTISAKAAEAFGKDITVLVMDATGNIVYLDQKPSNGVGEVSFDYVSKVAGDYTVSVGGDGIGRPNSTTFSITN